VEHTHGCVGLPDNAGLLLLEGHVVALDRLELVELVHVVLKLHDFGVRTLGVAECGDGHIALELLDALFNDAGVHVQFHADVRANDGAQLQVIAGQNDFALSHAVLNRNEHFLLHGLASLVYQNIVLHFVDAQRIQIAGRDAGGDSDIHLLQLLQLSRLSESDFAVFEELIHFVPPETLLETVFDNVVGQQVFGVSMGRVDANHFQVVGVHILADTFAQQVRSLVARGREKDFGFGSPVFLSFFKQYFDQFNQVMSLTCAWWS